MPELALDHALRIVAHGRAAAEDAGLNAVFAILDTGAQLLTLSRMDGAWLASSELAMAKARASVMFQAPCEWWAPTLKAGEPVAHFDHLHAGGLLLMGGGVPLLDDDGVLIGALRVSGGTPDQDAALARAAAA